MHSKDAHLYGVPKPKKAPGKDMSSSSSSLAFTSQLSSLIASGKDARERTAPARPRPKKDDIFSVHNRNAKKRALKDLDEVDFAQRHSTSSEAVDEATWRRAKRKMEEKARLYAAMKRGDIEDLEDKYAVDFDRKWAEAQEAGGDATSSTDDEDEDEAPSDGEELVDYVDEFGRNRRGTRAQAERAARRQQTQAANAADDRFTARPSMPAQLIYGDTIQSAAFDPDAGVAERMAALAAKRDAATTPPPETHFDARHEVRTRGAGFMPFSADAEERKREMEALEAQRRETEAQRAEAARRKEERRREVEERRRKIQERRTAKKTDRFLKELLGELEEKEIKTKDEDGDVKKEPDMASHEPVVST
ncbi:uncharacterized protein PV09_01231 [Verruconis gallopava]|uniref:Uncharacterized protein n=1 Tax=Verruconis gallopava TaxID=253628 RepID=A0A0D1Z5R7_9PEZI|nr:uncharacterized protein PV09_01231 [Verruconis gallopava]KIW08312.1 hypothetical protein PV09_01231 [Verruconis gallopava]